MKYFLENGKIMGKVLLVMYAVTAVFLFVFAAVVQKLQLKEQVISLGMSIVYVISCFAGGFLAGKIKRTKKFLWGMLLGAAYLLVMLGLTMLAKGSIANGFSGLLSNFLLCLGGGMLGGMLS